MSSVGFLPHITCPMLTQFLYLQPLIHGCVLVNCELYTTSKIRLPNKERYLVGKNLMVFIKALRQWPPYTYSVSRRSDNIYIALYKCQVQGKVITTNTLRVA